MRVLYRAKIEQPRVLFNLEELHLTVLQDMIGK